MNSSDTTVRSYQNFFVKTVSRSLQTASDSLAEAPIFTVDVRERGTTALDLSLKAQIAPTVWGQSKELLLAVSPMIEQAGKWDDWLSYLDRGVKMSRALSDQLIEGDISIQIGIFQQRQGEIKLALGWYQAAINLAKAIEDKRLWASGLNRLGFTASVQQKVTEASRYIEEAFALMDADDPQRELSYSVLGIVALYVREYEKAIDYFQQSLEIASQNKDRYQMAVSLGYLAVTLNYQGFPQKALDTLDQAVKLLETINAPIQLAITQLNQGMVYEGLDEPEIALDYYKEAKTILEKALNSFNLVSLYNNQGFCYYKLQQWAEAEKHYKACLLQCQQIENWFAYANALDNLGMVYHKQGQFNKAITSFQDALKLLSKKVESGVSHPLSQEIEEHLQAVYVQLADG